MGPGYQPSAGADNPMSSNHEVQLLERQTIEAVCAELCQKVGYNVPQGTAYAKVFGVMSAYADMIDHADFHLGVRNRQLSTIPLPFAIEAQQQVSYLNDFDSRAERASYRVAQELFAERWNPSQDSVLIVADNLSWALMINESGGITYWRQKDTNNLDALLLPDPSKIG